jgi:hypothetical protein
MVVEGFAERVIDAEPDAVLRSAREVARVRWSASAGPEKDPGGVMRERVLPIEDRRSQARLWVWKVGPRRTAAYLGIDERRWWVRLPIVRWFARRAAMRRAAARLEDLANGPAAAPRPEPDLAQAA